MLHSIAPASERRLLAKRAVPLFVLACASLVWVSLQAVQAQTPSVVTTTTYEYNAGTLQPTAVTVSSTDGSYRRTETTYAHQQSGGVYPDMEGSNMLSQVYQQKTLAEDGTELACSLVEWKSATVGGTTYVPSLVHEGCGADTTNVRNFVEYDAWGRPIHIRERSGLRTFLYYGSTANPFDAAATGPRLTAIRRTGYGVDGAGWNEIIDTRTGFSLSCQANNGPHCHEEVYTYDDRGRLEEHTDVAGVTTRYRYDGLGRLTEVRDGSGSSGTLLSSHAYDYPRDPNGDYDPANPNSVRTRLYTSSSGNVFQESLGWFDGLGRPIQTAVLKEVTAGIVDPRSDWYTNTTYDALGRPSRSWRPILAGEGGQYITPTDYETKAKQAYASYEGNGSGASNRPFAETVYEASPLARPTSVRAPGATDHRTRYDYGVERPDIRAPALGNGSYCNASGTRVSTGGYYCRPPGASLTQGPAPAMAYTETKDAEGRATRTYTDALGRTRFVKAAVGTQDETLTEMIYDAADRLLFTRPPLFFQPRNPAHTDPNQDYLNYGALAARYTYNTRGHLLTEVTPDRLRTSYVYDKAGRLRYREDTENRTYGKVHFFSYDALGRLLTEGIGRPVDAFLPDPLVFEDLNPDGGRYPDADASCTAAHFEWCGSINHIRRYAWDDPDDDRLGAHVGSATGRARVEGWPWDVDNANETSTLFPFSNTTGRLAATAYLSDGVWQSEFYSYDERGRTTERQAKTNGVTHEQEHFTYTYDLAGQLRTMRAEVGPYGYEEEYRYDLRGAVEATYIGAGASGTAISRVKDMRHSYEPDGQLRATTHYLVSSSSPGRMLKREYDVEGRLIDIGKEAGPQTMWLGTGNKSNFAPPYSAHYDYDAAGLIDRWTQLTPYAVRSQLMMPPSAQYPHSDDPAAMQDHWSLAFLYDDLGRLKASEYVSGTTPSYSTQGITYDANGNLLTLTRWAPSGQTLGQASVRDEVDELHYTYDWNNKLLSVDDAADQAFWGTTTWDADPTEYLTRGDGNMTRMIRRPRKADNTGHEDLRYHIFGYDEADRVTLESMEMVEGQVLHIYSRYNDGGWRIYRRINQTGEVVRNVRDGARTVGVFDATGTLRHWNTPSGRVVPTATFGMQTLRERSSYAPLVYWRDHLGSVRAVVNQAGHVVEARDYYAFGLEMPGRVYVSDLETRENYTGHERDAETGQLYAGARYYDAALGRWHVVDPLASQFPAWSPYNYVMNNPISLIDPNGEAPCCYGLTEGLDVAVAAGNSAAVDPIPSGMERPTWLGMLLFAFDEGFDTARRVGTGLENRETITRVATVVSRGVGMGKEQKNAVRHFVWQAMIASEFGEATSLKAGYAHETDPSLALSGESTFDDYDSADSLVDLLNNPTGSQFGAENPGLSPVEYGVAALEIFREYGMYVVTGSAESGFTIEKQQLTEQEFREAVRSLLDHANERENE